jgi:hypothetical protein
MNRWIILQAALCFRLLAGAVCFGAVAAVELVLLFCAMPVLVVK